MNFSERFLCYMFGVGVGMFVAWCLLPRGDGPSPIFLVLSGDGRRLLQGDADELDPTLIDPDGCNCPSCLSRRERERERGERN